MFTDDSAAFLYPGDSQGPKGTVDSSLSSVPERWGVGAAQGFPKCCVLGGSTALLHQVWDLPLLHSPPVSPSHPFTPWEEDIVDTEHQRLRAVKTLVKATDC